MSKGSQSHSAIITHVFIIHDLVSSLFVCNLIVFNYNHLSNYDCGVMSRDIINASLKVKQNREENDPCFNEHKISMKCLNDNAYDYDKCQDSFDNYSSCKKFWNSVITQRKRDNILPHLPSLEQRDQIKKEFFEKITSRFN